MMGSPKTIDHPILTIYHPSLTPNWGGKWFFVSPPPTEKAMRCNAKILAMRVLAAKTLAMRCRDAGHSDGVLFLDSFPESSRTSLSSVCQGNLNGLSELGSPPLKGFSYIRFVVWSFQRFFLARHPRTNLSGERTPRTPHNDMLLRAKSFPHILLWVKCLCQLSTDP